MTAADLAERLSARPTGAGRWQARCPAHDDHTPSLSIREGNEGRVLIRCWAGCNTVAVLAATGLTWADILGAPTNQADHARLRAQREARAAAEAGRRARTAATGAAHDAAMAYAGRLVARLAALEWAGAMPTYEGEAADVLVQYHATLSAAREVAE